ncbi:MAG: Lysyl-tRNA synthetase LysS [Candidatus Jorgensenbacteria bacterium GW2011_GWB1_49_9]|nr:MAG: Lysyl-tRNA synthetase LysS [Candidatus Jorgensenbacteria bacterium GW2011_GWB1_49_9]
MLEDIIKERLLKLKKYENKDNPYPARVRRDLALADFIAGFGKLAKSKKKISVVGRLTALRDQGRIIFADLEDETGKLQVVLNRDEVRDFDLAKSVFDIGDFAEIYGVAFLTQKKEKSILAKTARLVSKSIRPLPQKWYGLEDVEIRLRQRYLDLLVNPEAREIFRKKNLFWEEVRNFLKNSGFLEVETPVLENLPGGAEAEPFETHLNALDRDLYLRISLELPLKKLLVGGYEKVFEIGRIFRNEGIDREHLQDYTQMECYWAYADYGAMMAFTEGLYKAAAKKVCGSAKSKFGDWTLDWGKKWPKVDYYRIFEKETGLDLSKATLADLRKKSGSLNIPLEPSLGKGRLIDLIYKKAVRPKLIQPCFLIDPPVEIEPLAKRSEKDKNRVERFQIMAGGTELGKGFSELNDPLDQRRRFEEQMELRAGGDLEAQRLDEDFLTALEYGMPPAAGFGMSERLFAVLVNKPVRETVFFPLMREESNRE